MKSQFSQNSAEVSGSQPSKLFSVKPLKQFNVVPREWRDITTEEGRRLSEKEIQLLWTITRVASYSKNNAIQIDYKSLAERAGFDCSHTQMWRYIKKLTATRIITSHVKKHRFGCKKDLVIKIDFEKLNSQGSSGVEYQSPLQECNALMHTYKNNKNKNKEDRSIESNFFNENSEESNQLVETKIEPVAKPEILVEEPKIQLVVTKGRVLADFHPLAAEDCGVLRMMSGRDFSTNAINQILLDMSKRHKLKSPFFSKQTFLKYFARCLANEMRDAVKAQGIDFRIKANIPREDVQREWLDKYEKKLDDLSPSSLFKKKLSVSLPLETSFELLNQYSGHYVKSSVLTIFLRKNVDLSDNEREKIIQAANEVDLSNDEKRGVEEEETDNANTGAQRVSSNIYNVLDFIKKRSEKTQGNTINRLEIKINQKKEDKVMFSAVENNKTEERTGVQAEGINVVAKITSTLKKSYSENEYKHWFSKLTAKVNEEKKEVTLFAPSIFVKDWVESNYFGAIETIAKEGGYSTLITTKEEQQARLERLQQRELEKQQLADNSNN